MQEASDKGHLHRSGAAPGSLPDLSFVLATALDIANGMACIHAHDVIHRCLSCFTAWVLQPVAKHPSAYYCAQQSHSLGVAACGLQAPARCLWPAVSQVHRVHIFVLCKPGSYGGHPATAQVAQFMHLRRPQCWC